MATVTHTIPKGSDTRTVSGPALDAVIEEVLRPVPPLMRKLMANHLGRAVSAVRGVFNALEPFQKRDPYLALVAGAVKCIDRAENRVQEIESHLGIQEAALRFAATTLERETVYLETCRFLRRTPAQVRGDKAAFKRFMDWEAILELAHRAQRGARRYQQTLVYLASRALARCGPDRGRTAADVMEKTGFTEMFGRAIQQRLPVHLEREWIDAVVSILRAHQNPKKGVTVDPAILHALAVRAQNPWADVWVQCGALYAWLLASPQDALRLARQRLRAPDPRNKDDIFVRRFLVEKAQEVLDENGSLELLQSVLVGPDPSPHVRQGAILAMGERDPDKSWPVLREHVLMREDWDPVPEVRASVNLVLAKWAVLPRGADIALQEWRLYFERETEIMPLVLAMKHAGGALEHLVGFGQLDPKVAEQFVLELLEKGVNRGWNLPVRAACEDLLERVRVAALPGFSAFRDQVVSVMTERNREDQVDVAVDVPEISDDIFGRFLAWLSRRTFGLYAMKTEKGWRVTVGHQKRWRLWRWIHETLNPAPDKRQAHSHVLARRYEGTIRAHASGLGEESPTKVPGEPIQMSAEGGWRRFLPLPDDFLDSLEFGPCKVFASEGVVTITPPAGRKARWKLRWRLARQYAALAALREQSRYGNPEAPPNAYIERMRALGFRIDFLSNPPEEHSMAAPYFLVSPPPQPDEPVLPPPVQGDFEPAGTPAATEDQPAAPAAEPAEVFATPPQADPGESLDSVQAPSSSLDDAFGKMEEAPAAPSGDPLDELAAPPKDALDELMLPPAEAPRDALDDLMAPPAEPPKDPLDEFALPPAEAPADPLDALMLPPGEMPKDPLDELTAPPRDPLDELSAPLPDLPPPPTAAEGPDKDFIIPPPAPPGSEGGDFLT